MVSLEERDMECDLVHIPCVGLELWMALGWLGMSQEPGSLNYRSSGLSGAF